MFARRILSWALATCIGCLASAVHAGAPRRTAAPLPMSVRFVYLVSADRPVRRDFIDAIADAARTVQRFYARELGGPTFTLNDPIVEVARSDKPATWFYAHDTGSAKDQWGFDNGLSEAKRLLGAGSNQEFIWVIYSDGPGNSGRGGGGVAVMPEDDLLGLVGEHPTQKDPRRWVYGMAHELGHALGLSHPPDSAAVPHAIMGGGFYTCFQATPDTCELTPEDLATLRTSPFIGLHPRASDTTYHYDGGSFTRTLGRDAFRQGLASGSETDPREALAKDLRWIEHAQGGATFFFDELDGDADTFVLLDRSRDLLIRIPKRGGQSTISTNGGASWHDLYVVARAGD